MAIFFSMSVPILPMIRIGIIFFLLNISRKPQMAMHILSKYEFL